jgi:hypothetical protein
MTQKNFTETLAFTFLRCCLACSGNVYRGGPLVGVVRKILVAGTKFRQTSTADPLGVLSGFPATVTTNVEDVDDGPPGGCWRQVRQRPPPVLKTSMVGPLGVLVASPTAATTDVKDVDGGPPGGCCRDFQQRPPPMLKTSMAGPLRGDGGRSGSGHHRSWRRRWRAPGLHGDMK